MIELAYQHDQTIRRLWLDIMVVFSRSNMLWYDYL